MTTETTTFDPGTFQHQLAALIQTTPETFRHKLIARMARAVRETTPDLPANGRCSCGQRLLAWYDEEEERWEEADSYELDYSTGWQQQESRTYLGKHVGEDRDRKVGVWCDTERNDQHTVAHLLCPGCERLWQLPGTIDKHYA